MSAEQIPLPCSGCRVCCITEAPGAVLMAHDKSEALLCARGAGQASGGLCGCPGTAASIPLHPSMPHPIRVLLPPLLLPGSTPYLLPLISFNPKKKKKKAPFLVSMAFRGGKAQRATPKARGGSFAHMLEEQPRVYPLGELCFH